MNLGKLNNLQGNDYHIVKLKFEHYLLCVHYIRRAIMNNDLEKIMAVGLVLGTLMGVATGDMGLWLGVGLLLGVTLGTAQKK